MSLTLRAALATMRVAPALEAAWLDPEPQPAPRLRLVPRGD